MTEDPGGVLPNDTDCSTLAYVPSSSVDIGATMAYGTCPSALGGDALSGTCPSAQVGGALSSSPDGPRSSSKGEPLAQQNGIHDSGASSFPSIRREEHEVLPTVGKRAQVLTTTNSENGHIRGFKVFSSGRAEERGGSRGDANLGVASPRTWWHRHQRVSRRSSQPCGSEVQEAIQLCRTRGLSVRRARSCSRSAQVSRGSCPSLGSRMAHACQTASGGNASRGRCLSKHGGGGHGVWLPKSCMSIW